MCGCAGEHVAVCVCLGALVHIVTVAGVFHSRCGTQQVKSATKVLEWPSTAVQTLVYLSLI